MCLNQAVRDEARERVRQMEGREISQVTGKGDLLKGFPQGESPCKSFLWLLCGKQAEGSQNRRQRPEGVFQMGDEPHGEDPLQRQTWYMFRERELTGSLERRPQGARRIRVARAPRAEGKQSLPLAPNLPHQCPPNPASCCVLQGLLGSCPDMFQGRNRGQELPALAVHAQTGLPLRFLENR